MSNLLSLALPNTLTFSVEYDRGKDSDSSYYDVTFHDVAGEDNIFEGLELDAYCIDTDRGIGRGLDKKYVGQVYSSYETLPANLTQSPYIEKSENLDLANWILNQGFAGKDSFDGNGRFSSSDIQRAIWTLLDDNLVNNGLGREGGAWTQEKVDEILELAQANGENFVPQYEYKTIFGEDVIGKLGVIIMPEVNEEGLPTKQPIIVPVEMAKLGDRVWFDDNENGIQDDGEVGVPDVEVNLLADVNGDGTIEITEIVGTTTTDIDGNYHFEVAPGEYQVQFVPSDDYVFTTPDVGSDNLDSDADLATGLTPTVVLNPGDKNLTLDAGLISNPDNVPNDCEEICFVISQKISGKDGLDVKVTITEIDGGVQVKTTVVDDELIGDIRGVFFHIEDESLVSGLSVSGSDVTDFDFDVNKVNDLGQGANIKGAGNKYKFDGGVEIGTPGKSKDDIQETIFTISHNSQEIDVDDFFGQEFGIRLTSVGAENGSREDSLKLVGMAPEDCICLPEASTI